MEPRFWLVLMAVDTLTRYKPKVLATIWIAVVVGSLLSLSLSAQNSNQFSRLQLWFLVGSSVAVLILLVLVLRKARQLLIAYQNNVSGSKLTARTTGAFIILVALPLLTVYFFSLSFLNRGIDSWFKVEIKQGLNDAVKLSRSALELRMREYGLRTETFAQQIARLSTAESILKLDEELRSSGASEIVMYGEHQQIIGISSVTMSDVKSIRAPEDLVRQISGSNTYVSLEPIKDSLYLIRTGAQIKSSDARNNAIRFVMVTYDLPRQFAELTDAVQRSYSQYGDLVALREPLKYSFRFTLTLVLLVTLLAGIYGAIYFAEVLFRPVRNLMIGTRAVADGDLSTKVPVTSKDEMGFLVDSFNDMTTRLSQARAETERSQKVVERERTQLAIILARLSTGVITIDRNLVLQIANEAAGSILGVDLGKSAGHFLSQISGSDDRLHQFAQDISQRFSAGRDEWREQIEIRGDAASASPRILVCACVALPQVNKEKKHYVIVFDDVTNLLHAQRDAAWGEVARRLAHEIKNPLTPIQLSAERIRRRLLPNLSASDTDLVERSTQTIINQVESLKKMVDDFTEYARGSLIEVSPFNLNALVNEVLDLYRTQETAIVIQVILDPGLEMLHADQGRVRQVLNNLFTNAIEALETVKAARLEVISEQIQVGKQYFAQISVSDNGLGFPLEMIEHIFDPYVTSKSRGTGLGLAIVKKIVSDHGGHIYAENLISGGARIRVMLPLPERLS
ncbi:MAG: HAMP domain-containing protein [Gammaproteobacteria bacterium]|nr:HAMP domain-containing protein [Gammaproteobacteria bacterium]